jgi:hypothetical protein
MDDLPGKPGFTPQIDKVSGRQAFAIELIATVALTVALVVAATAVSLGKRSLAAGDLADRLVIQIPVARQ